LPGIIASTIVTLRLHDDGGTANGGDGYDRPAAVHHHPQHDQRAPSFTRART